MCCTMESTWRDGSHNGEKKARASQRILDDGFCWNWFAWLSEVYFPAYPTASEQLLRLRDVCGSLRMRSHWRALGHGHDESAREAGAKEHRVMVGIRQSRDPRHDDLADMRRVSNTRPRAAGRGKVDRRSRRCPAGRLTGISAAGWAATNLQLIATVTARSSRGSRPDRRDRSNPPRARRAVACMRTLVNLRKPRHCGNPVFSRQWAAADWSAISAVDCSTSNGGTVANSVQIESDLANTTANPREHVPSLDADITRCPAIVRFRGRCHDGPAHAAPER